jgi:competence protein ComEA
MQAAPSPSPAPGPAPPSPPPVFTAWPRSAQLAFAFLLGLATALVAVYAVGSLGGGRPTELQPGAPPAHRIDLNQAGHAELLQLPGVGEKTAQRIEDQRQAQGGFRRVDDIARVHGIGPATVQKLRPWVRVQDDEAEEESEPADPAAMPTPAASKHGSSTKEPAAGKSSKLAGPINLNRATADELRLLPGIGPKLSERILEERARGPFKTVDDLRRVSGIGAKTLERLRPYLTVEDAPPKVTASRPTDGAE